MASYLDNELDPEEVAEYEKKCLTSDVVLAEVASVHQILSLLGQKVKVPAAAFSKVHTDKDQLVKVPRGQSLQETTGQTIRSSRTRDQADPTMGPSRMTQTAPGSSGTR